MTNNKKFKYIVSDLPYAKNTKSINLERFFLGFGEMIDRCLGDTAVISFPDFVSVSKYFKSVKIKKKIIYPLHKSLAKQIIVVKRVHQQRK